jgi:hypothetical protein
MVDEYSPSSTSGGAEMKPGTPADKPIDPNEIDSLTPIDDLQLTKTYGKKETFTNWELPDVAAKKSEKNRKYSGHMQQMFCKYRTNTGRLVWGEWWAMNVDGRGSMNDNVAPGYQLVPNKKEGGYRPKMVDVEVSQFSQFWPADE